MRAKPFLILALPSSAIVSILAVLLVRNLSESMSAATAISIALITFLLLCAACLLHAAGLRRAEDAERITIWMRDLLEGHATESSALGLASEEMRRIARQAEQLREMVTRQLVASEEQKAVNLQILDSLREGIFAIDARRKVVFANTLALQLFGITGVAVGKPLVEIFRNRSVFTAFDRALEGLETSERLSINVSGEERQLEMRVSPGATTADIAAIGFFIDVSRIEHLERVRRDFLDNFSHEVRTPLAGLRSAAESFEAGPLTRVQEAQLRKIILRQLSRLERLVQDLAELNRIESGELVLNRQPTELRALILDLCDDFNRRVANGVRVSLTGGETSALVDPLRVQQIFVNLIDNAIKYGGKNGDVAVQIESTDTESVVRVIDQGEGIPRNEQERIFNRFHRLDRSRSQEIPGIGLGLAITRHLVLIHGGTITVESEEGSGSTFEVRFPRAAEAAARSLLKAQR
ncbi:MAG TPA: ATP-binding protein [Thermoanaerobaculia bacterium]|nr:ATP-binding protein [Thermoanaerobaculia bacterium]